MNSITIDTARSPTASVLQHDYILLDSSGSMKDKWWDTLDAIQAYVDGVKAAHIKSKVILHTFDAANPDCVQRDTPIESWKSLREDPIGGNWATTPLYDAINLMGLRLRDLDPPRCSIVIVTDGEENASQFTNLVQAKSILDWCRAKGWQVTFIGANFDNTSQSKLLGADQNSSIGVQQRRLSDATAALAAKRARYGLYGEPMHYTKEEQQQFGGYLAGPSPK